jgi:hypothetical protein
MLPIGLFFAFALVKYKITVRAGQGHISPNLPAPSNFAESEHKFHNMGTALLHSFGVMRTAQNVRAGE